MKLWSRGKAMVTQSFTDAFEAGVTKLEKLKFNVMNLIVLNSKACLATFANMSDRMLELDHIGAENATFKQGYMNDASALVS